MIQPPTIGPTVGASTASTPANVVARPWRLTGNRRNTAAKTAGISVPPEKPCRTRHAISVEKWSLSAHPTEARVNTDTDKTNSQRMLSKRVRKPVSGIATTSAQQISGLHPTHLVRGNVESALNRRQ